LDAAGAGATTGRRPDSDEDRAADSDHSLLQHYIATGSEEAFSQIVYRHSGWVYHTCRRNLRDVHLAEDATQAVFLLLCRKAGSIRPDAHLGGWLFQACRYVLADIRKSRARYLQRQNLACDLTLRRAASAEQPGAKADPVLSTVVDEAIAGLRENDRQTILMHFYEGLTLRQMAAKLSITREGAKKRVMRALARLRGRLAGTVNRAGKGSILPITALFLLLRTRAAEAAPADFVAAVAKSVTIPGLPSVFVELIVESVRRSAIRGTERLLTRLALTTVALSLLTVASMPFRSPRDSSVAPALAASASDPDRSGTRSSSAKALAASNKPDMPDDWYPGPPYEPPLELATTPPVMFDADPAPAEPQRAAPGATARAQATLSVSTVAPLPSSNNNMAAAAIAVASVPAVAAKASPQRLADPLWLPETTVVVDATPAAGSTNPPALIRPHLPPPSWPEDHRPPQAGDAHSRPEPPDSADPPPLVVGIAPRHWPDMPGIVPVRPREVEPAQEYNFVDRSPKPPPPEIPVAVRSWMPGPPDKGTESWIPPIAVGTPRHLAWKDGSTQPPAMIPLSLPGKTADREGAFTPPDALPELGFAMPGKPPPDFDVVGDVDPQSLLMLPMDAKPMAAWADLGTDPQDSRFLRLWGSPTDAADEGMCACKTVMSGLAFADATPSYYAMDAVVVPEPTGLGSLVCILAALAARRRR
jgi:RNA polymerase sigma factor (sigma-70 family)